MPIPRPEILAVLKMHLTLFDIWDPNFFLKADKSTIEENLGLENPMGSNQINKKLLMKYFKLDFLPKRSSRIKMTLRTLLEPSVSTLLNDPAAL